jgi:hypothetical protein
MSFIHALYKLVLKVITITLFYAALMGCSSPAKPSYQSNTLQKISFLWIEQGDKARQLENYTQAIALYQRGITYARKRHDLRLVAITQLKMAMSYVADEKINEAQKLVDEVKQMSLVSELDIGIAIANVDAHLSQAKGAYDAAILIWKMLLDSQQLTQEQQFYYQLKIWNATPESIDKMVLKEMLLQLESKKQQGTLNNIEILSYFYISDLKWAMSNKNGDAANRAIEVSNKIAANLTHFAELEQTAKIKKIYRLAIDYYSNNNMELQKHFYQNLLNKLNGF